MTFWANWEVYQCSWCYIWAYLTVGRKGHGGRRHRRSYSEKSTQEGEKHVSL